MCGTDASWITLIYTGIRDRDITQHRDVTSTQPDSSWCMQAPEARLQQLKSKKPETVSDVLAALTQLNAAVAAELRQQLGLPQPTIATADTTGAKQSGSKLGAHGTPAAAAPPAQAHADEAGKGPATGDAGGSKAASQDSEPASAEPTSTRPVRCEFSISMLLGYRLLRLQFYHERVSLCYCERTFVNAVRKLGAIARLLDVLVSNNSCECLGLSAL